MKPSTLAVALLTAHFGAVHVNALRGVSSAGAVEDASELITLQLQEGVTHTLDSAEVDGEFCDASSPLSYAGYMNGERRPVI